MNALWLYLIGAGAVLVLAITLLFSNPAGEPKTRSQQVVFLVVLVGLLALAAIYL